MPSSPKIKPALEHLAWLKEQVWADINQHRAYDAALLTYNAAAMLQWHFVMPACDADQIQDDATRKKAAKLIDDFLWAVKAVYEKASGLKARGGGKGSAGEACRKELQDEIARLLKRLPRLFGLSAIAPVRHPDLERTQDHAQMLRDWVRSHPRALSSDRGPVHADLSEGPGAGLRRVIAGMLVANNSSSMKPCPPKTRRTFRRILAGFVGFYFDEAADRRRGVGKRRLKELAQSMAAGLRSLGGRLRT